MAFAARRGNGTWELREAASTPAGPRSRTLATFRTLTPEVVAHAQERARQPLSAADARAAARRAGAPVVPTAADDAAGRLLAELASGRPPRHELRALLRDALATNDGDDHKPSDAARAAAMWVSASTHQRGEALRDLLDLTDRLPVPRARARERFPRLDSTVHLTDSTAP